MAYDAEETPPCRDCILSAPLSSRSRSAMDAYARLAARRVWDGMSGLPRALPLSEIRAEAALEEDPDAAAERIQMLDMLWMEQAMRRIAEERRREKAAPPKARRR